MPPLAPVIVSMKDLPAPALFLIFMLNVLVVVAGFGANVEVLIFGVPLTLKLTGPVKPFIGVTMTV